MGKKAQFSSVKKREKDEAEAKAKAQTKGEGDEARPVQATAANCVMKINVYRFLKRMAGGVSWFRARAWLSAKKLLTQISTLIMPIKSMISGLFPCPSNKQIFSPDTMGLNLSWVKCSKNFSNACNGDKQMNWLMYCMKLIGLDGQLLSERDRGRTTCSPFACLTPLQCN